ncbi:MAG: DUF169 domain-containing protein [archaeon]|nr:DUF169 domain-containing protein [archaeon]
METNIIKYLKPNFKPIVFLKTDVKPENALEKRKGSYGCLMTKIAKVIRDRETFVVSEESCSCPGAMPGFGFGSRFKEEKDIENHASFLSFGLECAPNKESFEKFLDNKPKARREFFRKRGTYPFKL